MPRRALPFLLLALAACGACGGDDAPADDAGASLPPGMRRVRPDNYADMAPPAVPFDAATPRATATPLASWPHDTAAYTQGLLLVDGRLVEGLGLEGKSEVRQVDLKTGRPVKATATPDRAFGEGTAVVGDTLYELTWRGGIGHRYDARTLQHLGSFQYQGEGWGLASDGRQLYMSDGSPTIKVVEPTGFRTTSQFTVTEAGQPVHHLNELELVNGELWANIYQTDWIARIDPSSGRVVGWINLGALLTPAERQGVQARGGTANGIAYDAANRRVLVTGKLWPKLFAIALPTNATSTSTPAPRP